MQSPTIWLFTWLAFTRSCWYSDAQKQYFTSIKYPDDNAHLHKVLSKILVPRVVGSPGHKAVREFIESEMQSLEFETEIDSFTAKTPIFGNLTFSNIIATYKPRADKFLTLACHYDSKYFRDNPNFVGAIDSAVPCAIMINIAKTLSPYLKHNACKRSDIGLKFIFFDGEEAFLEWTNEDSLYGSRHLANKMSKSVKTLRNNRQIRDIDRIKVLVLLDVIGAPNSKYYSFFPNTENLHFSLSHIERSLMRQKLIEGNNLMFMRSQSPYVVDDDHRPFLEKNVSVLHLITAPFPKQWHTADDNARNLHWPSIRNFNKVLRVFVYKYLNKQNEKIGVMA